MTRIETLASQSVDAFLDSLATKTPTPGGGAAASIVAALGAALGRMVLNYSVGKKKLAEHDALHHNALAALESRQHRAIELAQEDADAYGRLNDLWKLGSEDERRQREFAGAVRAAIAAPSAVLESCLETLDLLESLTGKTNRMLDSDLAIAAVLAQSGARSAGWNVRINLPLLEDDAEQAAIRARIDKQIKRAESQCRAIEAACRGRA